MSVTTGRMLELVERLKKEGESLPGKLAAVALEIESKPLTSQKAVADAIREFHPEAGWLCFQSRVCCFASGQPRPEGGPEGGIVLYGELARADGSSLHLRQDGSGGWLATTYREREGDGWLAEDRHHLAEPGEAGGVCPKGCGDRLRYRIYWAWDEESGYAVTTARFAGFETQEKTP